MRDLSPKIINLRRTYEIGMGNVMKVMKKEFQRVLGANGGHLSIEPWNKGTYEVHEVWLEGETIKFGIVCNGTKHTVEIDRIPVDDVANLYMYLTPKIR